MPKVVRDFIRRTTDPNHGPLTYEEARQFYSNASSLLSAEEAHHLAPQAKHLLSQFTSVLGDAIKDTVDRAGMLQDLLDAMSEYRSAARLGAGVKRPRKPIALEKAPWIGAAYAVAAYICREHQAQRRQERTPLHHAVGDCG